MEGGGSVKLPRPSVACAYVFELRWVTYRHCLLTISSTPRQAVLLSYVIRSRTYHYQGFDILVLMTFTSVDLLVCLLEPLRFAGSIAELTTSHSWSSSQDLNGPRLSWTCLTACFAYCRCCCCRWAAKSKHACSSLVCSDQPGFLCKGCCNICAWMACNCVAALCCLIPVGALFVYIVSGLVGGAGKGPAAQYDLVAGCCAKKKIACCSGATIVCTVLLAIASAVLVSVSLCLRYVLAALTGCFCKPLPPASWTDQAMLLHPLPPGRSPIMRCSISSNWHDLGC